MRVVISILLTVSWLGFVASVPATMPQSDLLHPMDSVVVKQKVSGDVGWNNPRLYDSCASWKTCRLVVLHTMMKAHVKAQNITTRCLQEICRVSTTREQCYFKCLDMSGKDADGRQIPLPFFAVQQCKDTDEPLTTCATRVCILAGYPPLGQIGGPPMSSSDQIGAGSSYQGDYGPVEPVPGRAGSDSRRRQGELADVPRAQPPPPTPTKSGRDASSSARSGASSAPSSSSSSSASSSSPSSSSSSSTTPSASGNSSADDNEFMKEVEESQFVNDTELTKEQEEAAEEAAQAQAADEAREQPAPSSTPTPAPEAEEGAASDMPESAAAAAAGGELNPATEKGEGEGAAAVAAEEQAAVPVEDTNTPSTTQPSEGSTSTTPTAAASSPTRDNYTDWQTISGNPDDPKHRDPNTYLSAIEIAIMKEINLARMHPDVVKARLELRRPFYDGTDYSQPGHPIWTTREGITALNDAIDFLATQPGVSPWTVSWGLTASSRDLVEDQGPKGAVGHFGADGSSPFDRMNRHGSWHVAAAENNSYGYDDPQDIVDQWIIDDGVSGRGHRKNLYNDVFTVTGIASGKHLTYDIMTVMDMAGAYEETE
eukprot:gnl/Spiro4/21144_TR10317_c0_g1_i1.p1 gnl/Spiro4/21144_TR10317_c0_g1~~gnl/Spiro4/21144_TR10317_c0_g1_i1.p1  ORF type:complete len:598 (+),score=123.51 gnl/Spiro4/21144_TR10317_c0_g1_i1:60-1853(+)